MNRSAPDSTIRGALKWQYINSKNPITMDSNIVFFQGGDTLFLRRRHQIINQVTPPSTMADIKPMAR